MTPGSNQPDGKRLNPNRIIKDLDLPAKIERQLKQELTGLSREEQLEHIRFLYPNSFPGENTGPGGERKE